MSDRLFLSLIVVGALALVPRTAPANPAGGVVRFGNATISGQGTPVVNIQQRSNSAILSWQQFNIQPGEATHFQQPGPGAVVLNRILDGQASQILGALTGNGHVYLINPNGILFGKNATVDVHAFMAATDVNASDLKKLTGGFDPSAVAAPGARIENAGTIRSDAGGAVYLIAPDVQNDKSGVILSPSGEVLLAAGATIYLTDRPDGIGLAIAYTAPGQAGGQAVNLGKLVADAGLVRLRASIVAQNGVVEANAVRERNGQVELYADTSLALGAGSLTAATGDSQGTSPGGSVNAYSADRVSMAKDATIDVSGGVQGGNGGSAEISARNTVDVSGTFRAGAAKRYSGGKIVVDPTNFTLDGNTSISGASQVTFSADQTLSVAAGATIALDSQGDPAQDQTLALRSGGDIVFGQNATIQDAGTGGGGTKKWNVDLLAGAAAPNDPTSQAFAPGSDGGVYLSGVTRDAKTGAPTPGANNGTISLTHGNLSVRAAGDVVIGSGGGLENVTGRIEVEAGRDLFFVATDQNSDSVIQDGSGAISAVAGGSVRLRSTPRDVGNAAIRTIGVSGKDAQGRVTQSDGGDIFIDAQTGNVDAGVGNRWVEPGPAYTAFDLTSSGYPAPPPFDVLPVVPNHILGIGTEAGGNVTVIAGGDVVTRDAGATRDGGSAENLSGSYTGSHIGVFGSPVYFAADPLYSTPRAPVLRPVPIPGAPKNSLIVIAGGNISGDFMVRNGTATFRAGYNLPGSVNPASLTPAQLLAQLAGPGGLVPSSTGVANAGTGWFGTLAIPVTVDLEAGASVDALALNGIALRGIENPSLVYPWLSLGDPVVGTSSGSSAIASYGPADSARLEATRGDVIMLGNNTLMPTTTGGVPDPQPVQDDLVLLLPPSLTVVTQHFTRTVSSAVPSETRDGDLIINAPFELFPSSSGKLNLEVAGQIRSAEGASSTAAQVNFGLVQTVGTAAAYAFTLPAGTLLRDPQTGLEFELDESLSFARRADAMPAGSSGGATVTFQATPGPLDQAITIPVGTRIRALDGQIYTTTVRATIPPASQRFSVGTVTLVLDKTPTTRETIGAGIALVFKTPDGREFIQTDGPGVTFAPGKRGAVVQVQALQPGSDAGPLQLSLVNPLPGIELATNFQSTLRPASPVANVPVRAAVAGSAGNQNAFQIVGLLDPIPGILRVSNPGGFSGGSDTGTVGLAVGPPTATATLPGPVGNLAIGHTLQLVNTAGLPRGVLPSDIVLLVQGNQSGGAIRPIVFRALPTDQNGNITSTRPDPPANLLPNVNPSLVWQGVVTGAGLSQSDAYPSYDARSLFAANQFDFASYYSRCHSGICSGSVDGIDTVLGTGPLHRDDPSFAVVTAADGFHRVSFDLAQQATISTANGSLVDTVLRVQQNSPADLTTIDVPSGNAFFGFFEPSKTDEITGLPTPIAPDPSSSVEIAGPGRAQILVGVESFAQADAALAGQPGHQAGRITAQEFQGSFDAFDGLDRRHPSGVPLGYLDATVAPWVPTASGVGQLEMQTVSSQDVGLQTIGNLSNPRLPQGGASLEIIAASDISLNDFGSIGIFQGGSLFVQSITGGFFGGTPPPNSSQRGVFSINATPASVASTGGSQTSGGGSITIDTNTNFDIQGNALVSAAGGSVLIETRNGSILAGGGAEFSNPQVGSTGRGDFIFTYVGSGISSTGPLTLDAAQKVFIGAGITGATISIAANSIVGGGQGSLTSQGTINLNVSGSISGTIQAGGAIQVTGGGTFGSGANVSSASLVAGGGAAVASNTGAGRTSAETSLASQDAAEGYTGGIGGGKGVGVGSGSPTDWRIEVSSAPCPRDRCD